MRMLWKEGKAHGCLGQGLLILLGRFTLTVHGQGYEKPFGDGFVGAPCSRGAFHAPYCRGYCVSPLPHGNCLVKASHLRTLP